MMSLSDTLELAIWLGVLLYGTCLLWAIAGNLGPPSIPDPDDWEACNGF